MLADFTALFHRTTIFVAAETLIVALCVALCAAGCQKEETIPPTTLSIAVVGPLTGSEAPKGLAIQHAVELMVREVNSRGGIGGHPVSMSSFDDEGTAERAVERAKEITASGRFFAVVGHHNSAASIAAVPIYDAGGVPMISPSATNDLVTASSPWSFATVSNNTSQARFLAVYVQHALSAPSAIVAADAQIYGRDLGVAFAKAAEELKFPATLVPSANDPAAQQKLFALLAKEPQAVLFVSAGLQVGAEIIAAVRAHRLQNIIIGPDALASERLPTLLGSLGCTTTDRLFLGTPLLFDAAGSAAQLFRDEYRKFYTEEPLWHAAYAYDAANIIFHGIGKLQLPEHFQESEVAAFRAALKDQLTAIDSPEKAVDGATGLTFFGRDGSAQKSFAVATIDDKLSSAYVQLTTHRRDPMLAAANTGGDITQNEQVKIGDLTLSRTNVVFVGARFARMGAFDPDAGTFAAEFDLWFRYRPPFEVQDFEIANATSPIKLGERVDSFISPLVGYTSYHVSGTFKANFLVGHLPRFGDHLLGISLRHRRLPVDDLLYVVDERGMGAIGQALTDNIRERQVLDPEGGWEVKRAWLGQEIGPRHVMGDPRRLARGASMEQSTIHAVVHVTPANVSARRQFIAPYRPALLGWLSLALLALALFGKFIARERLVRVLWTLQVLTGIAVMVLAEEVAIDLIETRVAAKWLVVMVKTFHIAWWFFGAAITIGTVERFVWRPLERRTARAIPRLARQAFGFFIGMLALLGVVAFVFKQPVTLLAMGGAVVAVVIGVAIQRNIADVFSGLAINLETPFRVGDWIRVDSFDEGKVIDINWRSTKIQNRAGSVLNIPNGLVAHSRVENFSFPNSRHAITTVVRVSRNHAPDFVKRVFERAIRATYGELERSGAKPDKMAIADYQGVEDDAAVWSVGVGINNYGAKNEVIGLIQHSVWEHAARAGIDFVSTQSTVHIHQGNAEDTAPSLDAQRGVAPSFTTNNPYAQAAKESGRS